MTVILDRRSSAIVLSDDQIISLAALSFASNALKVVRVNAGETAFEFATIAGGGDMLAANNLSDVASAPTSRTNLGLGTLATQSGTFSGTSSGTNTGDQTNIAGNAATVTTNANLTGHVTSTGNATLLGSFTIAQLSAAISDENISGTNTGDQVNISGNAATVTTNANLTGHVTSSGNAAVLGSFTVAQLNTALSDGDIATGGGTATGTNTGDNATNSQYSGLVSNATHTGDATGATALTVVKINGVTMSGLATGILKNTTGTGAPSIAVNSDLPVMSATVGGAVPTPPNNTTTFLRGDATFAAPTAAASISQTEIDFGETGVSEASFLITDANVSPTSKIIGSVLYAAPTGKDLDELDMDGLDLKFGPGSGQMTIYARGLDGYIADKFIIGYTVG